MSTEQTQRHVEVLPDLENTEARARAIVQILDDMKAQDIMALDLRAVASFSDIFIVCSGTSDRQVHAMAEEVHLQLKRQGVLPIGIEGLDAAQWVLIDYGDVVVHVFYEEVRTLYQIEKLWADAAKLDLTAS